MKHWKNLVMVTICVFGLQTVNVFAQGVAGANIIAHGILALAGGNREAKLEKLIDRSVKDEKISGSKVTLLRVKDNEVKSKAKKQIIALQNRLEQYHQLYQNNQPINIPKSDSDLMIIKIKTKYGQ